MSSRQLSSEEEELVVLFRAASAEVRTLALELLRLFVAVPTATPAR